MVKTSLTKLIYQTMQQGKSIAGLVHKEASTKLMEFVVPEAMPKTERLSTDLLNKLRKSISALERTDWEEAEEGVYPKKQLFDTPWFEWARKYPLIWLDLPSTWERRKNKKTRSIPTNIDQDLYPDYYLQNFHHQTDGYLSDYSAGLYDLQVEILFNGTADSMRRRIISPLKKSLEKLPKRKVSNYRILDVATGTGRTLKQIRGALPKVELIGIDLSAAYLKQARKYVEEGQYDLAQLIRGNAENMPFADDSMQAITCVFLLHELPPKARQNVLNECYRLLEPGGSIILADSIQIEDSPQFTSVLDDFHKVFHEPFYRDYINDDIDKRLFDSGFKEIKAESHFMTRVWTGQKPIDAINQNQSISIV